MISQPLRTRMQERQFTMRKHTSFFLFLILAVSFLSAFSKAALADDDPPGRVARLNYMQGSVSFQPGGEPDWVQANPNRPLTTGDNLWTDRNSRGELHIGSTAIRLSSETGISFLNLDDRTVQIQLAQGSLSVHIRRLDGGDAFEVDTPNLAFTVERSGENANVSGTDSLTFDVGRAEGPDGFDDWSRSRDAREEHARSAQYVSRDVIGYEDLDEYGEWRSVPDYGSVWFPRHVATGWAPYRFGHWVWIAPWGWTWVEDEPWGFAPFHYGRWAEVSEGWCWVPGPVVVRPVYAPALVAFVVGPRFNLSISVGGGGAGVAWFPLGPREVYVPTYRASPRYVQNVNVTNTTVNVTNVTNVYNNVNVNNVTYMHQTNVGAVTAVSHETFVNARPVGAATVRVNERQLQAAEVQRGVAVAPVRQSIVGAGASAAVRPSEAVMRRQVVVKESPAAPRVSYERQQQVLSAQPGRVPTPQQMDQLRGSQARQQAPVGKFTPFDRGNQNTSQPVDVPARQQTNQTRGQQVQQEPTGKFTPAARGNQNTSQPASVPPQQQQQPAVKFAPPARVNEDTYHPHQFERPQTAAPPRIENAGPPKNQKPPEKPPERRQESNKPVGNDQDRRQR